MHSFVRCSFIQQPFREHRAGTVVPGTGTDSLHAAHVLTPPNHGGHTAAGGGPIPCRTMPFFHWEEDFRRNSAHISGAFPPETYFHTSCWLHRRLGFRTVTASRVSSPRPVFTHGWKRGGGNFQTGTQGTFQHSQYLKAQHSLGN